MRGSRQVCRHFAPGSLFLAGRQMTVLPANFRLGYSPVWRGAYDVTFLSAGYFLLDLIPAVA
jgi:hypothetical protein